ncbi:MAG: hypothetical protein KC619_12775 [Myxococcales bacterium]|nr:hypothetical protein [Myxococcales bacterium]
MSTWILRSAALGLLAASFAACGGPEGPETETGADAALPTDAASATPDASSGPIDPPPPGPAPTDPRDMAAVFFSGHSLINVNTPTFFAQLAESEGRGVSFQLQMGLGSPMSVRLACPRSGQQADGGEITFDVQEELRRPGVYDTLIVTERHDIVDAMLGERSTAMARRFRDAFHAGNPAGQPFLFESWYTIDRADPEAFRARAARELVAWQCIASKVNETRGESPAMIVIPAGQMIAEVTGDIVAGRVPGMTDLGQLFLDDVHLTPEGNYLVALLHYGVAFRRTPVGLTHGGLRPLADPPPSISAELATYLQAVASRYVDRTFADASESQRSDAECIELLNSVCEAQYGAGHWACGDMPSRFRDVDAAIPPQDGDWCRR